MTLRLFLQIQAGVCSTVETDAVVLDDVHRNLVQERTDVGVVVLFEILHEQVVAFKPAQVLLHRATSEVETAERVYINSTNFSLL